MSILDETGTKSSMDFATFVQMGWLIHAVRFVIWVFVTTIGDTNGYLDRFLDGFCVVGVFVVEVGSKVGNREGSEVIVLNLRESASDSVQHISEMHQISQNPKSKVALSKIVTFQVPKGLTYYMQ